MNQAILCDSNETNVSVTHEDGSIIVIAADLLTRRRVTEILSSAGYTVTSTDDLSLAQSCIGNGTASIVFCATTMDSIHRRWVREVVSIWPALNVIVVTDVESGLAAMEDGAYQFVEDHSDLRILPLQVRQAHKIWGMQRKFDRMREGHNLGLPVRLPAHQKNLALHQQIAETARLSSPVFITGHQGAGKSSVARLIHQRSPRAQQPFVTLDCSSLSRDLIEPELFGCRIDDGVHGTKERCGRVEMAHCGTLFINAIDEMPLSIQPKFLEFIETRHMPASLSDSGQALDVRIIAATNRDLDTLCRQGCFRQDLYNRLNVLAVNVPSLHERIGEIPSIARDVLADTCSRRGIPEPALGESAIEKLASHPWPCNERELECVLERALVFCQDGIIQAEDIVFGERPFGFTRATGAGCEGSLCGEQGVISVVGRTLDEVERETIVATLRHCGGNKAKSARELGISEKSIYNKMRRLNIGKNDLEL